MSRRMRRRRSARQSFAVPGISVWLNVAKSFWDAAVPNGFQLEKIPLEAWGP